MEFKGKTALVIGGGRDIGRACALGLGKAGANVVISYHESSTGAESAVKEIEAAGGKAVAVKADVTQADDVNKLVDSATKTFGDTIHTLVHVAGGLIARKKIAEMPIDHWRAVLDVNLTSLFLTTNAVIPLMPQGGSIVTFASQAGRDGGGPGAVAYASSKGAVMAFTRGLAKELGPGIRVNSLCPGMIDTDFHNNFTKPEVREHVANITPLKREGSSDDVAQLVVYLASEKAAFITGTCIDINGGTLFS